jgi:hypothetical protein
MGADDEAEKKLRETTPDEIRAMSTDDIEKYVAEAGPIHLQLMDEAEALMQLARPLNENLYVARNILIDRGR